MAETLTPQQSQAVYDRGGRILISAAAGSGKTKVLVDRLLSYLTDPVDPANLDEFLIITYTNAAAAELRAKIAAKLTQRIAQEPENRHLQKQMQRLFLTKISTVHGFCGDLIREYAYRLDVAADFRVGDENECRELRETCLRDLLDRVYGELDGDAELRLFLDTQGLGRDDRKVPELIETVYNSAMCHQDPEGWLDGCIAAADTEQITDASQTIWGKFLMDDLRDFLDCQIKALGACAEQAAKGDMENLAAYLEKILTQLACLKEAETWDQVREYSVINYGRIPAKVADADLKERVQKVREACKKGLNAKLKRFSDPSEAVLQDMTATAAGVRSLVKLTKAFARDFASLKRSRRILDFGDLEHRTLDLLLGKRRTGPTALAAEVGRRYREIMVDEYQDSNGVQDAIFMALTREKQNCFLVGDVKQSIYRFRLADPGIFLQKYQEYVPAESAVEKQSRKVLLSHNFRSGPEIISAVNDVFRACMRPKVGGLAYGDEEALREGIPRERLADPAVELHVLQSQGHSYEEEASFVAERIQTMLREGTLIRKDNTLKPVEPDDIVILLRATTNTAVYYQQALEARGIRCTSGGGTNLLETEEVATARAFLQTIWNPRQDISLLAALMSPVFGFTADDLAAIRGEHRDGCIYDALLQSEDPKAVAFCLMLSDLRREARQNTLTALLEKCFALTRMDSIYAAMPGGENRSANLQAFFQLAADFEKGTLRDLSQFLEHLDGLAQKGLILNGSSGAGCVTIMTIHRSKGLEFPVVFLCNLARQFNLTDVRNQILCDQDLGLGMIVADTENRIRYPSLAKNAIAVKQSQETVSEELRVLYVAMTRARDRLIMTYTDGHNENRLKDIACRLDADGGELLCREAKCLGDWVLIAALGRMEAGELHALGDRPGELAISDYPWKITVSQGNADQEKSSALEESVPQIPENVAKDLASALRFHYPYLAATAAPSKQTATDRKGRVKDAEAAEDAMEPRPPVRSWRHPAFRQDAKAGKAYGSAIHAALQYIRYDRCGSAEAVSREIIRLVEEGYLTSEQGALVPCDKLARFFATDLGTKLRTGTPYLREFKFSILDDGHHYGHGLEGEKVLLQGVVDCALLEKDGITVIDFKTDRVTEQTMEAVSQRYRPQVETYGEALSRIYEMPIKEKYLYFFHMDRFAKL